MALNVRRVGDEDWPRHIKMLLVGNTGAGKTRMSSTAPNVLYLNAEAGLMSVRDRQPAVIDIHTAQDLLEAKMALEQEPHVREKLLGFQAQTVVIDTIDEVSRILQKDRLESQKKESMAIADWGWLGDQMRGILRGFRNLDMNVILCCHVKSSEDSESGRTVYSPAIQGAMGEEISGYVDLAVLLRARKRSRLVDGQAHEEIVRYMQCAPDLQHAWIKDRSGKLPAEFEVNLDDDFKRLDALIYGDPTEELRQMRSDLTPQPAAPAKEKAKRATKKPPPGVDVETGEVTPPPVQGTTVEGTVVEPPPAPEPTTPPPADPEPAPPVPEPTPPVPPTPPPVPEDPHPPLPAPPQVVEPAPEASAQQPVAEETITEEGPPWTCAECTTVFNDRDQADISYIRYRKRLCNACFRAAKLNKAR